MPISWADVTDDAVKIGLGGLITGWFGYRILRVNITQEDRKEKQSRVREEFRIIEDHLLRIRDAVHQQIEAGSAYLNMREISGSESDLKPFEIPIIENQKTSSHILYWITLIDTKLRLMGYPETASLCGEYHNHIMKFSRLLLHERATVSEEEVVLVIDRLSDAGNDLCNGLAQIHGELFSLARPEARWIRHPVKSFKGWWNY